ncbi:hypothetical protein [Micromonospora luteifusca]|uniref:hypothetical protein n=1 Tax=Micromonospora luteifusca TaxID=709860 RepID=UPI00339FD78B
MAEHVYGDSFIITNLNVSTADEAATAEHWYRHRTDIEDRTLRPAPDYGVLAEVIARLRRLPAPA